MTIQEPIQERLRRIEGSYSVISDAISHIDTLEAELRDLRSSVAAIPDHKGRIDTLEAALREIAEWGPWVPGGAVRKPRDIAREALGGES